MRRAAALLAPALLAAASRPAPGDPPPPASVAVRATTEAVRARTVIVQPGDTLSHIVRRTGAGAWAIIAANRLPPPYVAPLGRRLKIPGGRYHLVRPGERGIAIARLYGVDWSRIVDLNRLPDGVVLRAGDRLLVPDDREVASMSMEQRARAFRIDIDDLATGAEPAEATAVATTRQGSRHAAARRRPTPATTASPGSAEPVAVAPPTDPAFSGRFAWPLAGRLLRRFGTQPGGARNDGVNIAARAGTTVHAAADGVVAYAGDLAAFGKLVLIRHGSGWLTAYGHAGRLLVTRDQRVRQGQPIATVADTAPAREPQLHFEVRDGRRPVDPLGRLPRRN